MEAAAALTGVHKDTVYSWLRLGNMEGAQRKYKQFVIDVEKAIADYENRAISRIEMAAAGTPAKYDTQGNLIQAERAPNWKADAWRLERRFKARWARAEKIEVTTPQSGDQVDEKSLDRDIAAFALALGWRPPE